jgi:hypothetical protein
MFFFLLIKEASGFFLFVLAYNLCLAVINGCVAVEMQPPWGFVVSP